LNLNAFELAAAMLGAVALACAVNARALKLPAAAGLLSLGLAASLAAWAVDRLWPGLGLGSATSALDRRLDYPSLVLNLLLGYLLFAGALNVDLKALRRRGWSTAALATLGTVATAAMVAGAVWSAARAFGHPLPFAWALAFGVLISPTDPIAVLAMTKRTDLQEELRAQLEGEALFNDGIAVVLFRAALALAIGQAGGHADAGQLIGHAAVEAFGGAAVGLAGGLLAVGVLALVDDWATETLATVAIATAVYALAPRLGLSGPSAVVVAGLGGGAAWGRGRRSPTTRRYLLPFWHVADESLNAVLFFCLGLAAWSLWSGPWIGLGGLGVAVLAPLAVLGARWLMIAAPGALLPLFGRRIGSALPAVLTWAGVRGGLSMAMALSMPDGPYRPTVLAATLAVIVVSILGQSLTMERLALKTGYGRAREL